MFTRVRKKDSPRLGLDNSLFTKKGCVPFNQKIIFGGGADIIIGGGKNDHLYGDDDLKEAA